MHLSRTASYPRSRLRRGKRPRRHFQVEPPPLPAFLRLPPSLTPYRVLTTPRITTSPPSFSASSSSSSSFLGSNHTPSPPPRLVSSRSSFSFHPDPAARLLLPLSSRLAQDADRRLESRRVPRRGPHTSAKGPAPRTSEAISVSRSESRGTVSHQGIAASSSTTLPADQEPREL